MQLATAGEEEGREYMQAGEYEKAVQELQPLADQGSPTAEYLLGEIYFGGHGGDLQQALKWMTASAEQGYAQAQARLGMIYATRPRRAGQQHRGLSLVRRGRQRGRSQVPVEDHLRSQPRRHRQAPVAAERQQAEALVEDWRPAGAPVIAAPKQSEGVIGQIGQVIPGIRIQLAAVKNADEATPEWARLQKALATQLDGLVLTVESVDLGTKGIYHRIQAGPSRTRPPQPPNARSSSR